MSRNNLLTFHDRFWNKSLLVLADMERRGIELDIDYLDRKRDLALAEVRELERQLNYWARDYVRQTDCPINWNSPVQLKAFFYHFKCYPIPPVKGTLNATKRNTKRDEVSCESAIDWLSKNTNDGHELRLLLNAKRTGKLAQFMQKLPTHVSADGRLRTSIGPNTDTGRLSSRNPNLQQIPTRNDKFKMRKAFRAAEGKLLIVADYSQLEMYVMAHFLLHHFEDSSLSDDLLAGDVHTATAMRIWNDESKRPEAKTVNYAVPYGKTAAGLGSQITNAQGKGIGKAAAQDILDSYFEAYPGLDQLFELWRTEARTTGYVHTLLGRTRPLSDAASDDKWTRYPAERRAVNTPVQGSAADIVTAAMLRCVGSLPTSKQFELPRADLLMQIHDELIFEVDEDIAEEEMMKVKQIMENPFDKPLRVQLRVDAAVGATWGDCK